MNRIAPKLVVPPPVVPQRAAPTPPTPPVPAAVPSRPVLGPDASVFEAQRRPLPGPLGVEPALAGHAKDILEKVAYSRSLAGMSDEELAAEAAKQTERQQEATTGVDQDQAKAAEAAWKLKLIEAEQARRALTDPALPLGDYEKKLPALSDAQLAAEAKRLQAAIDDARSGPHTNEADAQALQAKLDAVHSEQAQRVIDDPKTPLLLYHLAAHRLSDGALQSEQAQVQAQYDAAVKQLAEHPEQARALSEEIAKLGSHLQVLNAELERRHLPTQASLLQEIGAKARDAALSAMSLGGTEAPPEPPTGDGTEGPAPEETGTAQSAPPEGADAGTEAAAPTSEPYQIQPGDTLGDLAWNISQQHGGTPSPEQVLADILALNPMPDPNQIEAGAWLQLPVYGEG